MAFSKFFFSRVKGLLKKKFSYNESYTPMNSIELISDRRDRESTRYVKL